LLGLQNRVLWITGKMTPLARQQLIANGWTLRQGLQASSGQPSEEEQRKEHP